MPTGYLRAVEDKEVDPEECYGQIGDQPRSERPEELEEPATLRCLNDPCITAASGVTGRPLVLLLVADRNFPRYACLAPFTGRVSSLDRAALSCWACPCT